MSKRGQITIYLLIAIVIIAILGFFIYINNLGLFEKSQTNIEEEVELSEYKSSAEDYINSCLKYISKDIILYIGIQGGYYNHPQYYLQDRYFFYSYYFFDGKNIMPEINIIEDEISKAISRELVYCVNDFQIFKTKNVKFEQGPIKSITEIKDKEIRINIKYPITINKDKQKLKLSEDYETKVYLRFNTAYDVAKYIIKDLVVDKNNLCLSCILDIAKEKDLDFNFVSYSDNEILFIIVDNRSIIKEDPYRLMFVARI